MQYPLTIIRTKLKEAFVSWESLDSFISGLTNSLYNGMYINEFKFTKALVSSAYKNNMVKVETVSSPLTSADLAKAFSTKARELFLNFQMPSTSYNAWHLVGGEGNPVTTWTDPEDIVILLRNDVRAYLDLNVLANAFQIDKATLLGNIYPVDNFDVYSDDGEKIFDGSAIFGLIADRNWFKIKPIDTFMENDYNANNRAMQYFLNDIKMYEFSLFANACVFATGAATVNATAVEFPVSTATITAGETERFALATTPGSANSAITYAISAEKDSNGDSATAGSIATVQASSSDPKVCIVTGVAAGTATLTATSNSHSDTIALTIAAAS